MHYSPLSSKSENNVQRQTASRLGNGTILLAVFLCFIPVLKTFALLKP